MAAKYIYALNLGEDGRVLSATYIKYYQTGMVKVRELPEGDISQYKYVDGSYVYDPIAEETEETEE